MINVQITIRKMVLLRLRDKREKIKAERIYARIYKREEFEKIGKYTLEETDELSESIKTRGKRKKSFFMGCDDK